MQLSAVSSQPAGVLELSRTPDRPNAQLDNRLPPLPLGLAAGQFLDLWLFRSAGIIAGLERIFRLTFLAGGAFGFLAFVFG